MRRVLFILGELEDSDVNWLVEAGTRPSAVNVGPVPPAEQPREIN